jgi:hypothetical protein
LADGNGRFGVGLRRELFMERLRFDRRGRRVDYRVDMTSWSTE